MKTEEFLKICRFKLVERVDNCVWDYCELWKKQIDEIEDVCLTKKKLVICVKRYDNESFDITNENLKDTCDIEVVAQNIDKDWYVLKVSTFWHELPKKYFSIEKKLLNAWLAVN